MKTLNVAFLWHMHQPCYTDALSGQTTLPWVRLHGIKAYYDMPLVLEEFPNAKATFNIVPSLIEQIDRYANKNQRDLFFEYTMKPAKDLTFEDRIFILRYFFTCNWQTMISPHKEYHALLIKRGLTPSKEALERNAKRFSDQNLLDLQCWFNLTWFGFKAIERKPGISELIKKAKNFTEEDKKFILDTQIEILREIPGIYQRLQEEGRIEISMSPYNHPILPVLINTETALRAMPNATVPSGIGYPEDAESQIKNGIELYKSNFGRNPQGMWPSEGSVSPEALELIRKNGIWWIATDEEILDQTVGGIKAREELLKPYLYSTRSGEMNIFFRDKNISNLISFTYHRQPNENSVANFEEHLLRIRESTTLENPSLAIILDGENPWEYYHDKGAGFLRGVYKLLSENPKLKAKTFSEIAQSSPEKGKLKTIHSGSWINHNFDVWIGKPSTNKAWELIKRTRDVFTSTIGSKNLSEEAVREAWRELYIAEGSDWFWWFSDYFFSDNAEEFDRLFRTHLMKIYSLIELGIPWQLQVPVAQFRSATPPTKPKGLICPVLDGKVTNFYEWSNAGVYEIQKMGSFMFEGKKYLNSIHYGFDLENFYIRIDPIHGKNGNGMNKMDFNIDIVTSKYFRISFPLDSEVKSFTLLESADRLNYVPSGQFNTISIKNIVELSIPFNTLEAIQKDTVRFSISVRSNALELSRYPRNDYLTFEVPTQDFEQIMWMV